MQIRFALRRVGGARISGEHHACAPNHFDFKLKWPGEPLQISLSSHSSGQIFMARQLRLHFLENNFPPESNHVRNKTVPQKNAEIQND